LKRGGGYTHHILRGIVGILLRSLLLQHTKVVRLCVVLRVLLLSSFLFQNLLQFLFRYWEQQPILFGGIFIENRRRRRSRRRRKIRQENHRGQRDDNEKHESFPADDDTFIIRSLFVLAFHLRLSVSSEDIFVGAQQREET